MDQLVIVALNVIDPPANFHDPTTPVSTNPWTLIEVDSAGSGTPPDYVQYIYWHMISAAETAAAPSFAFSFTEGSPAVPATVRSTGVAIVYQDTCTQTTPTSCANPILDFTSGSTLTTPSGTVDQSAATNVQANSVVSCAFGTSNTSVGFTNAPTPALNFENGNGGINGGLDLYDMFETGTPPMVGPFTATLPGAMTGDNVSQCIDLIPIGF